MHALAECVHMAAHYVKPQGRTLVALRVRDSRELMKVASYLEAASKEHALFHEPDIGNEPTAIACFDDGEIFRKLRLF